MAVIDVDSTPSLGTLTVNSVAGTASGTTKLTVSPEKEKDTNIYKYKAAATAPTSMRARPSASAQSPTQCQGLRYMFPSSSPRLCFCYHSIYTDGMTGHIRKRADRYRFALFRFSFAIP